MIPSDEIFRLKILMGEIKDVLKKDWLVNS
jgi:hypothetical protein